MILNSSNMTNQEYYLLNGELPPDRIANLLDQTDGLTGLLESVTEKIHSGRNRFPDTDFLSEHVDSLKYLVKSLRGENLIVLTNIIIDLVDRLDELHNSVQHGLEELIDAENIVDKIYAYC